MTLLSSLALFGALFLSALIPGPSVLAVVTRSVSYGRGQGLFVVFGVLIADYIFIFLALTGLSTIASLMGSFAGMIKYLGAIYLLWIAYQCWAAPTGEHTHPTDPKGAKSILSSVFIGLVTTLSNPKAILFYMGFFPAFVDVTTISSTEVLLVVVISTFSVGSVLAAYAFVGAKATFFFSSEKAKKRLNKLCGGLFASCGIALLAKG
ncbi:LysE family translocator [Enterovibrio sp. ZSDZ35]|uniref:LysE family translocator n=1 Tax=Enterovibrio qingdaonensis TaxID=2899818 RepID=A0ABT5QTD2_9GAMM|nr:LysE family translocator [Enterovibrio sp. ZSDZ35]MDD1783963.1 LysE family translocator [Enterovibrio sp. ZSDZ35]